MEFYDLSQFASPEDITIMENGMIDTSYRLTAINKLNPVKIRRRFTSAGTEQYGTQIIYIGYLLENDFRSPALFQQMQQNYPLTDDHMLSRTEKSEMYGSSSNHRTGSQQKSGTYRTDLYWNRYPFSEPYLQQKPGICSAV